MGTPTMGEYSGDWNKIARSTKDAADWRCVRCDHPHCTNTGHVLTVHHFDGDKSNNALWNIMALCQRCHLSVQARVDPRIPLMFEPADWIKPYLVGMYRDGKHSPPGPLYDPDLWREDYERVLDKPWPAHIAGEMPEVVR